MSSSISVIFIFNKMEHLRTTPKMFDNGFDETFPGRWIGRRGPIEWPARSPDLTPPDFFLWGVLKNAVYANKPRTIDQLKQSIQHEWNQISEKNLPESTCRSVVKRCRDCIEVQGRHFEHL